MNVVNNCIVFIAIHFQSTLLCLLHCVGEYNVITTLFLLIFCNCNKNSFEFSLVALLMSVLVSDTFVIFPLGVDTGVLVDLAQH